MSKHLNVSGIVALALVGVLVGCDGEGGDPQQLRAGQSEPQLEPQFDPGVQAPEAAPIVGTLAERLAAMEPIKTRPGWLRFVDPAVEDAAAAPILLERLIAGQDEPAIRAALAEAIGRTGGDYAAAVSAQLAVESDPFVREMLVGTLGRRARTADAKAGLMVGLQDGVPEVRAAAVRAIGQRDDAAEYGAALIGALADDEVTVRRDAARALGVIGDAGAIEALTGLLGDADADVRLHALRAIHRIDPQVAAQLGALDVLAQDDDRRVRTLVGKIRS